uniref:Proline rich 15 like n=1 Tax=Bos taurus TaxID=9913 RepID=A0AAA9SMY2_BOVIN
MVGAVLGCPHACQGANHHRHRVVGYPVRPCGFPSCANSGGVTCIFRADFYHPMDCKSPGQGPCPQCACSGPAKAGSPTLRSGNAMTEVGWWKLTFLRKKKSTPKVLYEIPDTYTQSEGGAEPPRPDSGNPNSNFNTRLEKIVDKNTKGKHVKVSNSGRFKEKKKVRASLAENPNLFDDREGKGQ